MLQRQSHALTVPVSAVNAFRLRLNSLLYAAGVMRDAPYQIVLSRCRKSTGYTSLARPRVRITETGLERPVKVYVLEKD